MKKDNNESVYAVKGDKLEKIAQKLDKVDITMSERQNVIIIKNKDGYCLYDPLKAKVVSKSFDYLTFGASVLPYEKNHFFIAEQNKKKGLINDKGKWVIEPIYYNLLPFSGELTLAQSDSLSFQYININGETLWKLPEDDKTAWNRTHFLESFSDCTPLIFKQSIGRSRTTIQYEIKGKSEKGGGCVIESKYLNNPNLEWMNKTMTCTYDNSLPFKEAIQPCLPNDDKNECDCEGELWDIMSKTKK